MTLLALAWSSLGLGFVHGLGADHLMAIAALTAREGSHQGRTGAAVATAVQFAAGHAVLLGVGAASAVLFGWMLPAAVESGAERLGGLLLVALGAAGLWSLRVGVAYGHVHRVSGQRRWHLHLGPGHDGASHPGPVVPTLLGAVFAVSSLRMLMLLAPFDPGVRVLGLPVLFGLIGFFGVGILIAMSLFGVVLARVLSLEAIRRLGGVSGAVVASASILLGLYWMF